MRAAHVQPRQPRHRRLEDRVDYGRTRGLSLVSDGRQQDASRGQMPSAGTELAGEAVPSVADAISVGDVGHDHGTLDDLSVAHLVLHVDVLGPVDAGDHAHLRRGQLSYRDH